MIQVFCEALCLSIIIVIIRIVIAFLIRKSSVNYSFAINDDEKREALLHKKVLKIMDKLIGIGIYAYFFTYSFINYANVIKQLNLTDEFLFASLLVLFNGLFDKILDMYYIIVSD